MAERKVIYKYYPPDFDPSAIARRRGPKPVGASKLPTSRMMAPFSMRCNSCGEYIYKGRKFNARKENPHKKYLGIEIVRLYIRCTGCSAVITLCTDPKNKDYECESGAKRNFEPWRAAKLAEETEEGTMDRLEREEGERDVMRELDRKVEDEKTGMAVADALDEIRSRNARQEHVGKDGVGEDAEVREKREREEEDAKDIEIAHQAFAKMRKGEETEECEKKLEGTIDWTMRGAKKKQKSSLLPGLKHKMSAK
ncbi:DUF572-domain-containing protein [Lophium mytilinum]|uniref:Splicing factor YJU2 n=1 Tax=Lophium mytilinum TaxID=390894 RepID=A0A6A6R4H5_9PEZI|nr:DUF572-domain-containing protein [Lophium mytilinum]